MTNERKAEIEAAVRTLTSVSADELTGPGDIIMEPIYRMVIGKYIVPLMVKRFQDLPGLAMPENVDQQKWEEWVLKQIKDSQSN